MCCHVVRGIARYCEALQGAVRCCEVMLGVGTVRCNERSCRRCKDKEL